MPLSKLLELLEGATPPRLPARAWHGLVGEGAAARLLRAGLLVPNGLSSVFPCDGCYGRTCPREVVPNLLSRTRPLLAVCGNSEGEQCETLELTEAEAEELVFSNYGFIRQLRRAFDVRGAASPIAAGFPEVQHLGDRDGADVFLAQSPALPGFDLWLNSLRSARVLVPTARALQPVLRQGLTPEGVEIVVLADTIQLGERGLVPVVTVPRSQTEAELPSGTSVTSTCILYCEAGTRELTVNGYNDVIAQSESMDLFLDATRTSDGSRYRGGRRDGDSFVLEFLTHNEAQAIIELVRTGRPLRAGEFDSLSLNNMDRLIERARKKLDVRLARYSWRAIHTIRGDQDHPNRWQFRPDQLSRWAVLAPLDS
ncbi:MAG: hypothetical protein AB7K71_17805 [Polyangiaceae bacterium]